MMSPFISNVYSVFCWTFFASSVNASETSRILETVDIRTRVLKDFHEPESFYDKIPFRTTNVRDWVHVCPKKAGEIDADERKSWCKYLRVPIEITRTANFGSDSVGVVNERSSAFHVAGDRNRGAVVRGRGIFHGAVAATTGSSVARESRARL